MARNTVSKYSVLSAEQLISDWLGDHPTEIDAEIVARHLWESRVAGLSECKRMVSDILASREAAS